MSRVHFKCGLIHEPGEPCPTNASPEDYAYAQHAARTDFVLATSWITFECFLDNVLVAVALAAAEQRGYERGREEGEDHMLGCWRFAAATSSP